MTATNYFSSDYKEARANFLDACNEAGANVESYKNPNTTPEGEPLYTDVAVLGKGDARVSLALGSGTHGVEGFCGSGIQNGLLREGLSSRLSPDLNVIMIHAINPYGFAHLRRFNEDNIDLNRNFVDHSKPYPQNPDYEALADAIAPAVYSAQTVKEAIKRLMSYGEEYGHAALQAAISGGQYSHPQGLFFGGQFETWSNKTFRTIVQGYLSSATRVAFIDIHTGLGPHGYGEIILDDPTGSPAYEYAVAWWGDRTKSTKAGESVSIELSGTVKHALSEMLPNAEHIGVTLEFGTVPYEEVFQALQAENWLYHHGGEDNPLGKEIKAEMRRVFYPDTDDWKALVWDQGKEVVAQALAGLSI
ncbi:M14 family metallopeptidase [Nitrospinae bacterium AH_259_B05_G02_I21]|nr:M14 family metallopeptidase [Nitrospinae bacterium AH_259_B05_G02_I21]